MICFEVTVNGRRIALAGQVDALALSASVEYHRMHPDHYLNVNAVAWREGTRRSTDSTWETPLLIPGDEARVRIVEGEQADNPRWQETSGVRMPPPWGGGEERCSFCGGDRQHRKTIFDRPAVKICDGCVDCYHRILLLPSTGSETKLVNHRL